MNLKERLETYDFLAVSLVIIGSVILLSSYIIMFISYGHYQRSIEKAKDLGGLCNLIRQIGILILGIGFFISLRKIYQKIELPQLFQITNYTYLILLLPQLFIAQFYYIFASIFEDLLVNTSSVRYALYYISYSILPSMRRLLLAIMFVLIFIAIVKKEWTTEEGPSQERSTEERLE